MINKIQSPLRFLLIVVIFNLISCDCWLNLRSKNVDVENLVTALRKDNLFTKFKGYGVIPRSECEGIYLVSREKDLKINMGIYHWVQYSKTKTKFITYYDHFMNDNDSTIFLNSSDSIDILTKAHELIGIIKELDIRWAGWTMGRFEYSFNDSTRMKFVDNKSELDSTFYRFHKNLNWIDSNFVTFK